jgi:hypothetical protein
MVGDQDKKEMPGKQAINLAIGASKKYIAG